MNESQWLASTEPTAMLGTCLALTTPGAVGFVTPGRVGQLAYRPSDRKLRLWCCAVVRQVWNKLTDKHSRRAVEVAEQHAEGEVSYGTMHEAVLDAYDGPDGGLHAWNWEVCLEDPCQAAIYTSRYFLSARDYRVPPATQAGLLRCVMGNPFRPARLRPRAGFIDPPPGGVYLDPAILTPTVLSLARAAYEDRPIWKCQRCWGTGDRNPGQSAHHYDRPKKSDDCPDCNGSGRVQDGTLDPGRPQRCPGGGGLHRAEHPPAPARMGVVSDERWRKRQARDRTRPWVLGGRFATWQGVTP